MRQSLQIWSDKRGIRMDKVWFEKITNCKSNATKRANIKKMERELFELYDKMTKIECLNKKYNTCKIILLIIALVLFFGGLTAVNYFTGIVQENPSGTVGNHAGNLYNNGLFCEHDGKVYFSNPYDENTLYVMNPDETDIKKIGTVGVTSLNAGGKYIYYYQIMYILCYGITHRNSHLKQKGEILDV